MLYLKQLIVATNESELDRFKELHKRGIMNEVPDLKVIGQDEIREIEPNCRVSIIFSFFYTCVVHLCSLGSAHKEASQ